MDGGGDCFVLALAVPVDEDLVVLEGGFVAVEGDLFDCLGQVGQVIVGIDFEELDQFLLLEGRNY